MEFFVLEEMILPVCWAVVQGLGAGGVVVSTMKMIDRFWKQPSAHSKSEAETTRFD